MSALWPIILRSLRARPLRSLLTATAVALGVGVIVGVHVTLGGLDDQARAAANTRAGASGLDVRSPSDQGLSDAQVATLSRLAGVARAEPLHEKRVTARAAVASPGLEATLLSVSSAGTSGLRPITMTAGRLPHNGARDEVAVDAGLTTALVETTLQRSLHVGDSITLTTVTGPDVFRIVGITAGTSGGAAFSQSGVFVSDSTLLSNFSLGLRTPLVALQLTQGATPVGVAGEVATALRGAVSTNNPRIDITSPLDQLQSMLVLVTVLSLIVGAGVTANSISLSVLERRREIGLLRAAGAGAGQVYRIFMAEGVVCATAGAVVGIILGLVLGAVLIALRATGGAADGASPTLHIDPLIVAMGALLGVFTAFLGGSLPAIGAARMPPLAAIRPAPNAGQERPSYHVVGWAPPLLLGSIPALQSSSGTVVALGAAMLLAGFCASLPVLAPVVVSGVSIVVSPLARQSRLAAASLNRRSNRTALTAAGLVVSVATAVAASALTGGALSASDRWINRLLVGDAIVHSGVVQPDVIAKSFSARQGVHEVSSIRFFSEEVRGSTTGFATIDPAMYARHDGFDFIDGDRVTALRIMSSGPNVLIPLEMANQFGLRVGDTLNAGTGTGAVPLNIVGVIDHAFPTAGGREAILIAGPVAVTNFGAVAAGFNDLQVFADTAQLPSIQDIASRYGMQATSVATIRDSAQNALENVVGLLLALSGITVGIAMLAVVNTLLVTVRQSARELGLLRAVGMARGRAVSLLLTESALLAGTGGVIGVGAGCLLAIPMLRVSASQGFDPRFVFPIGTAALAVVVVMLGAILATLVPARRAARASIVSSIRFE